MIKCILDLAPDITSKYYLAQDVSDFYNFMFPFQKKMTNNASKSEGRIFTENLTWHLDAQFGLL